MANKIIDSKVLRDVVILELDKYKHLLIELNREGYEKVDELIQMLEDEDNRERTSGS